jgi:hypothetical protein
MLEQQGVSDRCHLGNSKSGAKLKGGQAQYLRILPYAFNFESIKC